MTDPQHESRQPTKLERQRAVVLTVFAVAVTVYAALGALRLLLY